MSSFLPLPYICNGLPGSEHLEAKMSMLNTVPASGQAFLYGFMCYDKFPGLLCRFSVYFIILFFVLV